MAEWDREPKLHRLQNSLPCLPFVLKEDHRKGAHDQTWAVLEGFQEVVMFEQSSRKMNKNLKGGGDTKGTGNREACREQQVKD